MKLVRFRQRPGENRIGVCIDNSRIAELAAPKTSEPILDFVQDPKNETKAAQALDSSRNQSNSDKNSKISLDLDNVTVLPPISRPTKIICMGGNFSNHLQEGSTTLPPFPISFLKSPTALVGHRAPIVYPKKVKLLDYEWNWQQ